MRERYNIGIWVGIDRVSDEHFVTAGDVLYRAAYIKLLPMAESWNLQQIKDINIATSSFRAGDMGDWSEGVQPEAA